MKQREFVILSDLKDGKEYDTHSFGRVLFRKRYVGKSAEGETIVRVWVKSQLRMLPLHEFIVEKKKPAKTAAERKRLQRAREKEAGMVNVSLKVSPGQLDEMKRMVGVYCIGLGLDVEQLTPKQLVEVTIKFALDEEV